ncbi:MAG: shikimate dehydrogenase [Desulfobacteraceae bacterium]|nr:shikimate dehydrogenase [Desulfobacteraceae bacterium]
MTPPRSIGTSTKLCAVIGNPIAHSLSPAIHNAAYQALGLDFVYVAFRVEDVKGAIAGMRALENFRGLSVTIPHKIEVMRHVDQIDAVDRSIGAINTVVREGDRLIGFGTDGPGALKALTDAGVALAGKQILMLGAGGAARSIAFPLIHHHAAPAALTLLDINEPLLNGLSADLASGGKIAIQAAMLTAPSLAAAMETADVIIHCTSVGMHPRQEGSLVPAHLFRSGQVVFDIVYTPLETRLLADARHRGLQTISGAEMFINQAVLQFERFTGAQAPVEVMRQVVMEKLKK